MTAREALDYVREHGVVLESSRSEISSLAEAIIGGRIHGSWWAHPRSHEIFAITRRVRASDEILVCRLAGGKITFVHRSLWPSLVRLADRWPADRIAKVTEVHTASGRHRTELVPFPAWVPPEVKAAGDVMSEEAALGRIGRWIPRR